eukprot:jgi/Bigna1/141069/aug1.60_g15777
MADEKTRISAKTYEVELRDLWPKIFLAFDSDNSGSINRAEVKLMQAADDNNDNEISMEEWAEMFDSLYGKAEQGDLFKVPENVQLVGKCF